MALQFSTTTLQSSNAPGWQFWLGDLNNDNKRDLIYISSDQNKYLVFLSTGNNYSESILNVPKQQYDFRKLIAIGDFDGDNFSDFVAYDGKMQPNPLGGQLGFGVVPYFYKGDGKGHFQQTSILGDAYQKIAQSKSSDGNYYTAVQVDNTCAPKYIKAIDFNNDGTKELWVESTGAKNIFGHFVKYEANAFVIETDKTLNSTVYFKPEKNSETARYSASAFFDVNKDGLTDMVMGQSKGPQTTTSSYLLLSQNSGVLSTSPIKMPDPELNRSHTMVKDIKCIDINKDGLNDLILLHVRYDMTQINPSWDQPGWNGWELQVLLQNEKGQFLDYSHQYIYDSVRAQSAALSEKTPSNIELFDINQDGYSDILVNYDNTYGLSAASVKGFLNIEGKTLKPATSLQLFGINSGLDGSEIISADINGDNWLDAVTKDQYGQIVIMNGIESSKTALSSIVGTDGAKFIVSDENDVVIGTSLNDSIPSSRGSDKIDGGLGFDVMTFSLNKNDVTIKNIQMNTFMIAKNTIGSDEVENIERLKFYNNDCVALDVQGNAGQAYRLYKAALDRTPDPNGLAGWIKYMDDGAALTSMSKQFIDSQEFRTKYGSLDNTGFVNQLYVNVLARKGEAAGVEGWVNGLANGLSRAQVLAGFSESSENQANVIGQIKDGITYNEWWLA